MIKNIVFDMGNVLFRFDHRAMMEAFGVPEENRKQFDDTVFNSAEWVMTDRGSLSPEAAADIVCPRLPVELRGIARRIFTAWWEKCLPPVPGMADFVSDLHASDYGLYLLSNASKKLHTFFNLIEGSEFFDRDRRFVSADYLLLKPEHEIFERFFQVMSLEPSECLFIDDNPQNIESAKRSGMNGIVFHGDVAALRGEFAAFIALYN